MRVGFETNFGFWMAHVIMPIKTDYVRLVYKLTFKKLKIKLYERQGNFKAKEKSFVSCLKLLFVLFCKKEAFYKKE